MWSLFIHCVSPKCSFSFSSEICSTCSSSTVFVWLQWRLCVSSVMCLCVNTKVNTLSWHQRPQHPALSCWWSNAPHILLPSPCEPAPLSHQQTHPVMLMSILLLLLPLLLMHACKFVRSNWVHACLYYAQVSEGLQDFVTQQSRERGLRFQSPATLHVSGVSSLWVHF